MTYLFVSILLFGATAALVFALWRRPWHVLRNRTVLAGAHEDPADVGMLTQAGQ